MYMAPASHEPTQPPTARIFKMVKMVKIMDVCHGTSKCSVLHAECKYLVRVEPISTLVGGIHAIASRSRGVCGQARAPESCLSRQIRKDRTD